ncbi:MAG: aminomethyl-transferring glycine dehydrogenase [Acidobacteriota bacterium]
MTETASPRTATLSSSATGAAPFHRRHNGPDAAQADSMLERLGLGSIDELLDAAVPAAIRMEEPLSLSHGVDQGLSELEAIAALQERASQNQLFASLIGQGYADVATPPVIQRCVLEDPNWYTAYTPYQAEIAQGRLEALLNFQTMVMDLTGFEIANASLLDEGTAAAEAMALCYAALKRKRSRFLVSEQCHPQTISVVQTRGEALGVEIAVVDEAQAALADDVCGLLLQYPATDGGAADPRATIERAKEAGVMVVMAADPLALTLLTPPAELGADIAVGSTQRFGMPMGFGGPHAAYIATNEKQKRLLPGRVVGVSQDREGRKALRLALQTREQHIRRDRATSNICTAQVLPAVVASMYAVYHGPEGLRSIALEVHEKAARLGAALAAAGERLTHEAYFDSLAVDVGSADRALEILDAGRMQRINLRDLGSGRIGISPDESTSEETLHAVAGLFGAQLPESADSALPKALERTSSYLEHPVFHAYRSEPELVRYIHRLVTKDLSLTTSMIPLGSCTMKLNAAAEMMPITLPGFARLHPFAPAEQTLGYRRLLAELEDWLTEITGFDTLSLQPNAGSQGELAGLLTIRSYHQARGDDERNVCLIPTSAHGTNPASAVMASMKVVPVACDDNGNIDVDDLAAKAKEHKERLAALMVTYPSTHGVFEEEIRKICSLVHEAGGQVYMDGANLNAQVGVCRPGDFGADVSHLNLHKTFCIPHGGGGPGMGPIGVMEHLAPYLPDHPVIDLDIEHSLGTISAAPWGSGMILPISWAYIAMMGSQGLRRATEMAILNANYMAERLEGHYDVLYRGARSRVAHECILDLRPLKDHGIEVDDVAKRLMDYGFHAPTVSWPVAGTVMVEPTESESQAELDRFCDAMIAIREEARAIERGEIDIEQSPLRHAPHTAEDLLRDDWDRAYSRELGAYPAPWTREHKYWPPVARIDNAFGDRNLVCSCVGMDAFSEE